MSSPSEQELKELAEELGECMKANKMKLATAESCTGGWLAKIITDIPGSSEWFSGSVVCYSNESKMSLLGVSENTLNEFGAVSGDTVKELADGLFSHTDADVAVSVSGIAGPDGGSEDKPVGLVWLSWAKRGRSVHVNAFNFALPYFENAVEDLELVIENIDVFPNPTDCGVFINFPYAAILPVQVYQPDGKLVLVNELDFQYDQTYLDLGELRTIFGFSWVITIQMFTGDLAN